jgi:hypothetical protein
MHQTTKHYKVAHVPNEYVAKTLENIMYQRKIKMDLLLVLMTCKNGARNLTTMFNYLFAFV